MAKTYEAIATTTLGSAASSITFSSIANTWTDLRVVLTGTISTSGASPAIRFNSDTGTNYSQTVLTGNGSAASSYRQSSVASVYIGGYATGWSSTIPSLAEIDIFSYAGSTYKTALSKSSQDLNGSGSAETTAVLWRSASAITSVSVFMGGAYTFNTGTTATLYGIKAA